MTASSDSRVGTLVEGKYQLVRLLGRGGMGEVYEARHLELGRRVAIKFLLPHASRDAQQVSRFRTEARASGRLLHENIAAAHDVGSHEGAPYLVLELLEGEDCARMLAARGAVEPRMAVNIVLQACRGLGQAHAHGIVHRDLKPANLFLCTRAEGSLWVKVLDFGIAKLWSETSSEVPTDTGAALGTPYYMSPEQARGEREVDARTDLYALGVILYELLTGCRPIRGDTPLQILHRVLTQSPTPIGELKPELAPELCAVVHRALAKDPAERFQSVQELAEALAPWSLPQLGLRDVPSAPLTQTLPSIEPLSLSIVAAETNARALRSQHRRGRRSRIYGTLALAALLLLALRQVALRSDAPRSTAAVSTALAVPRVPQAEASFAASPVSAPRAGTVSGLQPAATPLAEHAVDVEPLAWARADAGTMQKAPTLARRTPQRPRRALEPPLVALPSPASPESEPTLMEVPAPREARAPEPPVPLAKPAGRKLTIDLQSPYK